ncbi:hypothetical protein SAMN05444920_119162 [Nonomuraea solani]|uniref:Uncharacterized protein n=1 Tax=Nonomuraea solani TaxID=1144553 RepID=A0A1H6ETV5_9ACTN|nr:hypothetical protein SAMN05444920_119162 [Nonomuraea solani]
MDALSRGIIVTAAAILPGRARRERYREQWLAAGAGAPELEISPLTVALGALRAALAMNLTRGSAVALGLAAVLVMGGIRLATITPDPVPGAALTLAGVALPVLLLIIRRFTERDTPGDWDSVAAGRGHPPSPDTDAEPARTWLFWPALAALAALLLYLLFA